MIYLVAVVCLIIGFILGLVAAEFLIDHGIGM